MGIYPTTSKESPQEHRKRMIDKMCEETKSEPFQSRTVEGLIKDFMFENGSSLVRTKEYFDIVCYRLGVGTEIRFNDGKTTFIYAPSKDTQKSLDSSIQQIENQLERLKQEREKIEQKTLETQASEGASQ